ncbi:MAG: phage tail tape measure protein [Bacteroidales bacterium]
MSDFNVRYRIDINEQEASSAIMRFSNNVAKETPKILQNLNSLQSKIDEVKKAFSTIGRQKVRLADRKKIEGDIESVRKKLNTLKNKTVKVTVNKKINTVTTNKVVSRVSRSSFGNNSIPNNFGVGRSGGMGAGRGLLSAVGVPFAGMLGVGMLGLGIRNVISEAIEYENTMASVRNILKTSTDDLSTFDDKFSSMAKNVRQLGIETKFTATEVASATKYLAMAGLNAETIDMAMRPITNLAIIGDEKLDKVADVVTNIITGFNIKNDDISSVSDIISSITTSSNTSVMEMAESFKFAAGQLSIAKVDFREASAAIGVLANAGMKGTLSGTALRAMMIRMLAPTKKAKDIMDRLGISFIKTEKQGDKTVQSLKSLHEIMMDLKKSGASVQDINGIYDKVAGGAALNLFTHMDELKKLTEESEFSGGLAQRLADEKMKTVQGLLDQIKSQFQEVGISVYQQYEPLIQSGLKALLDKMKEPKFYENVLGIARALHSLLNALTSIGVFVYDNIDWIKWLFGGYFIGKTVFSSLSSITTTILGFTSAIKGASGVMSVFAGLFGGTGAIGGAAMAGPIGIIAAIVSGLSLLIMKWSSAKKEMNDLFEQTTNTEIRFLSLEKMESNLQRIKAEASGCETVLKSVLQTDNTNTLINSWVSPFKDGSDEANRYYKLRSKTGGNLTTSQAKALILMGNLGVESANNVMPDIQKDIFASASMSDLVSVSNNIKSKYLPVSPPDSYQSILTHIQTGLFAPDVNLTSDQIQKSKEFQETYGERVSNSFNGIYDAYSGLVSLSDKFRSNPKNISSADTSAVINSISSMTGVDIDRYKLGWSDDQNGFLPEKHNNAVAKIRESSALLKSLGINTGVIDSVYKALGYGDLYKSSVENTLGGSTDLSTNDPLADYMRGSGKSGTGGMGGNSIKKITVNIGSLMDVKEVNLNSAQSIEEFKDLMSQTLIDIVTDFEISNT